MPTGGAHQDHFTFVTDENGGFVSLSQAVYFVLGYHQDELIGKSLASIAAPDSAGRSSAIMYQMRHLRQSLHGAEIGLARKDGSAFEAEISGRPIMENGQFRGYQGVVIAISAYQPADVATPDDREAQLLLDLVCHDINNMNQVESGYVEMAMESLDRTSPAYDYLEKCLMVMANSSALLRNVQNLRQISTGARTLEKVDLESVIRDAIRQSANGGRGEIRISVGCELECYVMANALLKDAFLNILGNAIKHSREFPVIEVRVEKIIDEGKGFFMVAIDDNGPGIPDEMKRRLFNRFEHGTTPTSGKGLGLYLVRKLIEGYGGHVWVEDRVQGDHSHGSRFVVVLPDAGH